MLCASLDTDPRTIQDCAPSRLNFPRRNCHKKKSQLCETDITTLVSHGDSHKVRHGVSLGVIHEVSLAIGLYKHVLVSDMGSVKGLVMRSVVESVMGSVFESVMGSVLRSVMGSVRWSVLRSVLPNKCMSGQQEIYKKFINTVNDSPTVHEISTDYPRRCHMKIFCPGLWSAASQ